MIEPFFLTVLTVIAGLVTLVFIAFYATVTWENSLTGWTIMMEAVAICGIAWVAVLRRLDANDDVITWTPWPLDVMIAAAWILLIIVYIVILILFVREQRKGKGG